MSLTVFAAGSLRKALPAMAAAVGLELDIQFGPAGLLRRGIEEGARPDLFFSASMEHARAVSVIDEYDSAREFAENRLCLFGRQVALSGGDALSAMLDAGNRLGTSTPGADPGGDYAFSVFDRAEALQADSREILRSKALTLVGGNVPGKGEPGRSPVVDLFETGQVDIFLGYRTTAQDILLAVEGLLMLELPPKLAVEAVYGVTVLRESTFAAQVLAQLYSAEAAVALERTGFRARGDWNTEK